MLYDFNAEMQVIGSIIKMPAYLNEDYNLEPADFKGSLQKLIFMTVYNLFMQGIELIQISDIVGAIEQVETAKHIFTKHDGINYIQDCIEIAELTNFDYYYKRLKKFSALRDLQSEGFNTTLIYPDDKEIINANYEEKIKKFDDMSVTDVFNFFYKKVEFVSNKYLQTDDQSINAGSNLRDLVNRLQKIPDIGAAFSEVYFDAISRGARLGKLYVVSGSSGSGKSRRMFAAAAHIAINKSYDWKKHAWVYHASQGEKVCILTTELDYDEVQTILLAHVSGVNESKILEGRFTEEERLVLEEAISIIEQCKDDIMLDKINDPCIGKITQIIKRQYRKSGAKYFFYDYIFSSPSLLSEFAFAKVREDVALMMFSTQLKELARNLNIFIMTGTQLNNNYKETKGIKDQSSIRGAKSIIDKADLAGISVYPTQEEIETIGAVAVEMGYDLPNQVMDIYKNRRGQYKNVRIWSKTDLGTARVKDLFVTNERGEFVPIEILCREGDESRPKQLYLADKAPVELPFNI